tara:strand:- start:274 stop:789 length:516 start_codon:yes stop_codon:yes gene_type:complete
MLQWILTIITAFSITAFSYEANQNADGIGTFIGGENPFPWGRVADMPGDLGGIWEVGDTDDGAYFIIDEEIDGASGKPRIRVHLLDPCSLEVRASGTVYVRNEALVTTLIYPGSDLRVKLKLQAYKQKSLDALDGVQVVLMVMNANQEKKIDKYFPVNKVGISEIVKKCEE